MKRVISPGTVEVMVGASSEDIKFTGTFDCGRKEGCQGNQKLSQPCMV